MAQLTTIDSGTITVNNYTLAMQLRLYTHYQPPDDTFTFAQKGIKVADWGDYNCAYDMNEFFLSPGKYALKLFDTDDYLKNEIFHLGTPTLDIIMVEVWLNGVSIFSGKGRDDSFSYDYKDKTISFDSYSSFDVLNTTMLVDGAGVATNPLTPNTNLDHAHGYVYKVKDIIKWCYQLINPSITENFYHDWYNFTTGGGGGITNGTWDELYVQANLIMDNVGGYSYIFGDKLGDVLRGLAKSFFAMTGLIDENNYFFVKLFYYNGGSLQDIGTIYSHVIEQKYHKISYVVIADPILGKKEERPDSAHYTTVADEFIEMSPTLNYFSVVRGGIPNALVNVTDPLIGTAKRMEKTLADLWYNYRSDPKHCRVDRISVPHLNVDFFKNFLIGNSKYQIIGLTKRLGKSITEIEALYLGEL